jgi:hypothetical protein
MSLFGLTAIRKNADGGLVSAVVQQVNGATNEWLGTSVELDVGDIAAMIVRGDEIWSVFVVPEGSVLGPRVRGYVDEQGYDSISLENPVAGRTFDDLWLLGTAIKT